MGKKGEKSSKKGDIQVVNKVHKQMKKKAHVKMLNKISHKRNGNKTTTGFHYTYTRMAQMKTNDNTKC